MSLRFLLRLQRRQLLNWAQLGLFPKLTGRGSCASRRWFSRIAVRGGTGILGDTFETDEGFVEIRLNDETDVVLPNNTQIQVGEFVFESEAGSPNPAFSALRGICQRQSKIGPRGGAKLGHFGFAGDAVGGGQSAALSM